MMSPAAHASSSAAGPFDRLHQHHHQHHLSTYASNPYYPSGPYNTNVPYYPPPNQHYPQYAGQRPNGPPNRPYFGPPPSHPADRQTSPQYAGRPTSPPGAPPQYRSRSPDLVQVARPYRNIIGSLSSGEMPSGGQLQNLLHSAIEGLHLLDPEAAQQVTQDDISHDDIRYRKTRPRVEYMERPPPNQLTPPLQADSGKSLDEIDSEDDEKPKGQIKRRKREGAGPDCSGCHSTTTPEWRRGPMGPRTLCNACGLVYGKLVNKKRTYDNAIAQGQYIAPAILFADEANEGWGDKMPTTPEESLALIKRVRKAVVGGGHPRKPKDGVSSPSSNGSSGGGPRH